MIITKQVELVANSKTLNYYKNKGYDCNKVGEILNIKVEDLSKYSRHKILVQCDYCGKILEKSYNDWIKGQKFIQKDSCKNCCYKKTSEVNKLLYGCENVFQVPEVKEKIKLKIQEQYGSEINNGSGHNLSVKRGYISEKQFLHKEKYREKILFDNDYKIIYFNSKTDILPEPEIIQDVFNYSLNLIENFNKHRITIDLDKEVLYSSIGEIDFKNIIKTMND